MGTPPPRPLYQDAAAALLSFPKRPNRNSSNTTAIPRGYSRTSAMNSVDSVRTVATERRLPSTCSLGQRWDRSGATTFRTKHNPASDYRWQAEQPIIFAETPASRRTYALRRDPLASQSAPQRHSSISRLKHADELDFSKQRAVSARVARHQSEKGQLQAATEATLTDMVNFKMEHAAELQKLRENANNLEDLKMRERALNSKNACLETKQATFDSEKASFEKEKRNFESTVEEIRRTARIEAMKDVQSDRDDLQRRSQALTKRKIEMEDHQASRMRSIEEAARENEASAKWQRAESLRHYLLQLKKDAEEWRRLEAEGVLQRAAQRGSQHSGYSLLWDDMRNCAEALQFIDAAMYLKRRSQLWQDYKTQFEREKPYKLLEQYPRLNKHLTQFYRNKSMQAEEAVHHLNSSENAYRAALRTLKPTGHLHRALTRTLTSGSGTTGYHLALLYRDIFDLGPIETKRREISAEIIVLRAKGNRALSQTERQEVQSSLDDQNQLESFFQHMNQGLRANRQVHALQNLSYDAPLEKRVFVKLYDAQRTVAQAQAEWLDYIKANPSRKGDSSLSRGGLPTEVARRYRQIRDMLSESEMSFREQSRLEQHLGFEKDAEDLEADKFITAKIKDYQARSDEMILKLMKTARAVRGRTSLSIIRSVAPRLGSTNIPRRSALVPVREKEKPARIITSHVKQVDLEHLIGELRRRLKHPSESHTEEDRTKDKQQLIGLRKRLMDLKLPRLKKALQMHPSDSVQAASARREIQKYEAFLGGTSQDQKRMAIAAVRRPSVRRRKRLKQSRKSKLGARDALASSVVTTTEHGLSYKPVVFSPTPALQAVFMVRTPDEDIWKATSQVGIVDLATLADLAPTHHHTASQTHHGDDGASPDTPKFSTASSPPDGEVAIEGVDNSSSDRPSGARSDASRPMDCDNTIPHGRKLTYHIPPEEYRKVAIASPKTGIGFWSSKLYRNAEGRTPRIHYCTTFEQAEEQAKHFLNEPIVGFDLEWEPGSSYPKSGIKSCVSLIQIASEDRIGLFQIALFKGETADELLPPSLRAVLESRNTAKTGVNVTGDATRLRKCLNIECAGIFELSQLYKVVAYAESLIPKPNRMLVKLADLVLNVLRLPLKKDEVRVSAWSKRLNTDQTEYAATDAYAGFQLYYALEARRMMLDPMPPRPAFCEERKPLIFHDGTMVAATSKSSVPKAKLLTVKTAVVDEDDEEGDEYFDAVESLDALSLDAPNTAGVPLSGLNVVYPTLPRFEEFAEAGPSRRNPVESEPTPLPSDAPAPVASRHPPPSPEIALAESWVTRWRASLPPEYNLRVGNSILRAYHLWHKQGFDCVDVASMLRVPPLSIQTVASYVIQAVNQENLPYDADRLRAAFEILPRTVHGRYQKILNQINA